MRGPLFVLPRALGGAGSLVERKEGELGSQKDLYDCGEPGHNETAS